MTKLFLTLSFCLMGLSPILKAEDNIPEDTKAFNQELNTNLFLKVSKYHEFLLRLQAENNEELDDNRSFGLDYRHRIFKGVKFLMSYRAAYGLRHNEDWDDPQGVWRWNNTDSRSEQIYGLGLQYKKALDNERKHALKLRSRLLVNSFNDQQDLSITLGHLYTLGPKNLTLLQSKFNIPLSYARQSINYYSVYYGLLHFLRKDVSIGPQLKYTVQRWTESLGFKDRTGRDFEVKNTIFSVGLILNFYPEIF